MIVHELDSSCQASCLEARLPGVISVMIYKAALGTLSTLL